MIFDWYPLTFTSSAALVAASIILYTVIVWRRDSLSHVPYHRFDHDDSPQNYIQNSGELLHTGYLKV